MKKTIFVVAFLFAAITVSAQFYVSVSAGPTFGAGDKKLSSNGNEGSYGEGFQGQIRGGYFFNEKFGVDLAIGYLHGDSQEVIRRKGTYVNAKARAYGAALSGIYNVTKNMYVRAGLLTKLGGKTVMEGYVVKEPVNVEFTRYNKGSFPIGFAGALGFKFDLIGNFDLFAELEYMGINVDADKSKLNSYSVKLAGKDISEYPVVVGTKVKKSLGALLADEITYVDNPTLGKPEAKSFQAPYSSLGFNFGISYTF